MTILESVFFSHVLASSRVANLCLVGTVRNVVSRIFRLRMLTIDWEVYRRENTVV